MKQQFLSYYQSERQNAGMRILASLAMIVLVGIGYYFYPLDVVKGVAAAVIPLGFFQMVRGVVKFKKANQRYKNVANSIQKSYLQTEIERLNSEMPSFKLHRNIEIILIVSGIVLVLLGGIGKLGLFMLGTGIGLSLHSAISLYLELIAEWYAGLFVNRIQKKKNTNFEEIEH